MFSVAVSLVVRDRVPGSLTASARRFSGAAKGVACCSSGSTKGLNCNSQDKEYQVGRIKATYFRQSRCAIFLTFVYIDVWAEGSCMQGQMGLYSTTGAIYLQ